MQETLSTGYFFRVRIRHCFETVNNPSQRRLPGTGQSWMQPGRLSRTCADSKSSPTCAMRVCASNQKTTPPHSWVAIASAAGHGRWGTRPDEADLLRLIDNFTGCAAQAKERAGQGLWADRSAVSQASFKNDIYCLYRISNRSFYERPDCQEGDEEEVSFPQKR